MAALAVIGLGPVGLATSIAFALERHQVVGLDIDEQRLASIARGEPPFFESGMAEALQSVLETHRFAGSSDLHGAVRKADLVFVCVGTPSGPDGSMDDGLVRSATQDLAEALHAEKRTVVVVKSTVVPGTTEGVVRPLLEASGAPFGLAVNPEFLREGRAMEDALNPDRIILGSDGPETTEGLRNLYAEATCPIVETDLRTAETIKYATNAFLATKVAYADELANICRGLDVSFEEVIEATTLDPRINPRFLVPGVGFGGSCFPKDVRAFAAAARTAGETPALLEAVLRQNESQFLGAITLLEDELGGLEGRRIALLGLAFKGETDDVRESRALPIAQTLQDRGAQVVGYDPIANSNFADVMPTIALANSAREALTEADGCILQADWPEFRQMTSMDFLETMKSPVVVDGRRILDPATMDGVRFSRI